MVPGKQRGRGSIQKKTSRQYLSDTSSSLPRTPQKRRLTEGENAHGGEASEAKRNFPIFPKSDSWRKKEENDPREGSEGGNRL